jgi:CubicO group peptidase (beta-lactamase class C family)
VTRLLVSCLLVVLALESHTSAPPADAIDSRIDQFVRAEMDRQHIPGVAIGIVRNGKVVKAQGYGYANVEHNVPVGPDTIFQSGSLGKMFTAAAVMLQVESGRIALADPITKFLTDAPPAWQAITIRHLLTHTSGIPDYTVGTFDYRKDYTEDELAKLAYGQALEFPPGSRWNYSNTGYLLLGVIVHKASGRFYGDVLADSIFKPLGMTTTRVISEADIVPHRAAGYRLEKGELKNQDWVAPSLNTTADGALYFSVRDLIAWDAGVRARRVLSADSWTQILTPARLTSGKPFPYGFGWSIEQRGGHPLHEHGGSWQGFKTQFSRFIGDDLSIIVLANLREADPPKFADGIAALVNPALAVPEVKPVEDREPKVTARMIALVDQARRGALSTADFAYVRAGFFPDAAQRYADELRAAGELQRHTLLQREELGDDRVYLYELEFASGTLRLRLALAPDERVAGFSLTRK